MFYRYSGENGASQSKVALTQANLSRMSSKPFTFLGSVGSRDCHKRVQETIQGEDGDTLGVESRSGSETR